MGNFTIVIHGTGPHHNYSYEGDLISERANNTDADLLTKQFVENLTGAGHTIQSSTFTSGSMEQVDQIIGTNYVNPNKKYSAGTQILLTNITREMGRITQPNMAYVDSMLKKMTIRFMEKYEKDLFSNSVFMSGPVHYIEETDQVLEAKSRKLSARYSFEGKSATDTLGKSAEDTVIEVLIHEAYVEFKLELEHPENKGKIICPYILFTSNGAIDPFQPVISFITRYSLLDKEEKND